ncbi:MAG: hypothetical protein ACI4ON_06525 [Clostridia bacterium]
MKNIKEKIKKLFNKFKKLFETYPLTLFVIVITTIILAITIDTEILDSISLDNILLFSALFGCGNLFIETIFKKIDIKKISLYILSAIFALTITFSTNIENDVLGIKNTVFIGYISRIIVCYLVSTVAITIYIHYKNSKLEFNEYILKAGINFFRTGLIYLLLVIGLAMITSVFVFLLLSGENYSLVYRVQILLIGFFLLPMSINSVYDLKNEIDKFEKIIVRYVLDVLVIIAFVVIYLYIGKIIILRDMPANQIFRIIAILFVIGCPIWIVAGYFKDNDFLAKINNKLPILFIPFILLQIYTIGVRIYYNGMTEPRYLCIMLIIFEIIYTIIYMKNKEKIGNIILVLVIITIISGIIPYLNMFKISQISQYNNLKIIKEKENLSELEKEKVAGAYYYLKDTEEGKELITGLLTQDEIDEIVKYNGNSSNKKSIYLNKNVENIDIADYNKLYVINSYNYYKDYNLIEKEFKNIKVDNYEIDLSNIILEYIANEENIEEYFEENNEYVITENKKIIIESLVLYYDSINKTVTDYSLDGYLLVK